MSIVIWSNTGSCRLFQIIKNNIQLHSVWLWICQKGNCTTVDAFNYRPQRSCGKVMFLHLSVILFTGGMCGQTPNGQTPSWADTPGQTPPLDRHPPQADTPLGRHPPKEMATAADGMHPTGMHSCLICYRITRLLCRTNNIK